MPADFKRYWINSPGQHKIGTKENTYPLRGPLYLDTARLGLMSSSAQRLHNAFARLAGEPHGLLYFSEFFRDGYKAWPEWMRQHHPDLAAWHGINGLAESVRQVADASPDHDVLFASRSASLMRMAAWEMATRCTHVLTVDLLWPPYRKILTRVCRQAGVPVTFVRLRDQIYHQRASPPWIIDLVTNAAVQNRVSGLVLPALTHRGIRLPVEAIINRLHEERPLKMTILDAAQALGHTPLGKLSDRSDFILAGAHKWLRGGHPLGIGIGRLQQWRTNAAEALRERKTEDPLMLLSCESAGTLSTRYGETACLAPLFSAQGALNEALTINARNRLAIRLRNRRLLENALRRTGWRVEGPRELSTNGILLAKPLFADSSARTDMVQRTFSKNWILATTYRDGAVRFAIPDEPIPDAALHQMEIALHAVRDQCVAVKCRLTTHMPSHSQDDSVTSCHAVPSLPNI